MPASDTPEAPAKPAIARAQLNFDLLPSAERVDLWREAVGAVYEITPDPEQKPGAFSGALTTVHLGDALLSEVRSGAQVFKRSRAHARRTGLDHFMVQMFRRGRHDGMSGDTPVHRGRGDIWVLDLGQESHTDTSRFSNITLIIPREIMLPLLKGGDIHGATLRQGSPSARLIASHLEALAVAAPELTPAEAAAAVDAAALMIAGAWSSIRESRAEVASAMRASARRAVRDYIDQHLGDDSMTPELLARLFHMSRATLYRLFEEEGGVAGYILGRRLDRCRAILAGGHGGEGTIGEIAFNNGFGSDAHFSRAFRRRFGIAPRDARGVAHFPPLPSVLPGGGNAEARAISDWIATLRRHYLHRATA